MDYNLTDTLRLEASFTHTGEPVALGAPHQWTIEVNQFIQYTVKTKASRRIRRIVVLSHPIITVAG